MTKFVSEGISLAEKSFLDCYENEMIGNIELGVKSFFKLIHIPGLRDKRNVFRYRKYTNTNLYWNSFKTLQNDTIVQKNK